MVSRDAGGWMAVRRMRDPQSDVVGITGGGRGKLGPSWPSPFGRAAFVGTWLLRSCSKLGLAPTLCWVGCRGEAMPRPPSSSSKASCATQSNTITLRAVSPESRAARPSFRPSSAMCSDTMRSSFSLSAR